MVSTADARSPRADHLGDAGRRQRADLGRAEPCAGGDDGAARRDVATDGPDVCSVGNAVRDRDRCCPSRQRLVLDHRVGAVGDDTARRDPHRLPGRERRGRPATRRRSGRRRAASPACPPSARHSRPSPSWETAAGRRAQLPSRRARGRPPLRARHALGVERPHPLEHERLRRLEGQKLVHAGHTLPPWSNRSSPAGTARAADRQRGHVGGLGRDRPRARPRPWPSSCSPPTPTPPASTARRGRPPALAHANVCALFDYGQAEGRRFMVLEYLPGGSLEDRLATGKPLPDDDTRRIAGEIAAGLAHAHERGVVHRDLKPANILFDAEGGRRSPTSASPARPRATGLTEAGTVLGTAAYISPEQAAGRPATPASDVYAFGVILFRMLTGRLPFESQDALALAAMHRDLPAPPVSDFRPDAPPLLESVAAAALAKSPADRPQDGGALVAELGRRGLRRRQRLDRRHRGLAPAASGAAGGCWPGSRSPPSPRPGRGWRLRSRSATTRLRRRPTTDSTGHDSAVDPSSTGRDPPERAVEHRRRRRDDQRRASRPRLATSTTSTSTSRRRRRRRRRPPRRRHRRRPRPRRRPSRRRRRPRPSPRPPSPQPPPLRPREPATTDTTGATTTTPHDPAPG